MDAKTTVQTNILDKTNHIQKYQKSETKYSVSISCSNPISTILYRGVRVIVYLMPLSTIFQLYRGGQFIQISAKNEKLRRCMCFK
jgi:hypothetical protein